MKYLIASATLMIIVLIGLSATTVEASLSLKPLGGYITTSTQALKIQEKEDSNYKCTVTGTSFSVKSVVKGSGTNFLVPAGVTSKANGQGSSGKWTLGLYSTTVTPITCIYQGYPPTTAIVNLNSITLYGNSGGN